MIDVKFYRSSTCPRCKHVEFTLRKILAEMGLKYEAVVKEKTTDNPAVLEELKLMGVFTVPALGVGEKMLVQNDALNESKVRSLLTES